MNKFLCFRRPQITKNKKKKQLQKLFHKRAFWNILIQATHPHKKTYKYSVYALPSSVPKTKYISKFFFCEKKNIYLVIGLMGKRKILSIKNIVSVSNYLFFFLFFYFTIFATLSFLLKIIK